MNNTILPSTNILQNTPTVESSTVETDMQLSLDKDAFEVALQDAAQRQSMGEVDRLTNTSADVLRTMSLDNDVRQPDLRFYDVGSSQDNTDSVDTTSGHLCVRESVPSMAYTTQLTMPLQSMTVAQRGIADPILHLLQQRLSVASLTTGQALSLEIVNDPSGVQAIDLIKNDIDRWEIKVSLSGSTVDIRSDDLMHSLRQNGFDVASLTIDVRAA